MGSIERICARWLTLALAAALAMGCGGEDDGSPEPDGPDAQVAMSPGGDAAAPGGAGPDGARPPGPDGQVPGGMMPPPGMTGGPISCDVEADCEDACAPGAVGCTGDQSPMGLVCVPTCESDTDCPSPMLTCRPDRGICAPGGPPMP